MYHIHQDQPHLMSPSDVISGKTKTAAAIGENKLRKRKIKDRNIYLVEANHTWNQRQKHNLVKSISIPNPIISDATLIMSETITTNLGGRKKLCLLVKLKFVCYNPSL